MSRGDRVPRPVAPSGWKVIFLDSASSAGWADLYRTHEANLCTAYDAITQAPRVTSSRQHVLKGDLGTRKVKGVAMEQWQFEVGGAARVWYVIDDAAKTLWISHAGVGHPKATD